MENQKKCMPYSWNLFLVMQPLRVAANFSHPGTLICHITFMNNHGWYRLAGSIHKSQYGWYFPDTFWNVCTFFRPSTFFSLGTFMTPVLSPDHVWQLDRMPTVFLIFSRRLTYCCITEGLSCIAQAIDRFFAIFNSTSECQFNLWATSYPPV